MAKALRSDRDRWTVPCLVALVALLVVPSSAVLASRQLGPLPASAGAGASDVSPGLTVSASSSAPAPAGSSAGGSPSASPAAPAPLSGTFLGSLLAHPPTLSDLGSASFDQNARADVSPSFESNFKVTSTLDLVNGTKLPGNVLPDNCVYPMSALYVPGESEVYVACFASGNVSLGEAGQISVVDPSTDSVVGTILTGVGASAEVLVSTPGGTVVAVADTLAGSVTLIDPATASVLATLPVGADPVALAVDNTSSLVFVANLDSSSVTVLNASSELAVTTLTVGQEPVSLAYDATSDQVFVACSGSGEVTPIGVKLLTVHRSIEVGEEPIALADDPTAGTVLVANEGSDNVSVISTSGDDVVASPSVATPLAVAVDPTNGEGFVASELGEGVVTISPGGSVGTTITLGTPTELVVPDAFTVDAGNGDLYVNALTEPVDVPTSELTIGGSEYALVMSTGVAGAPLRVGNDLFNFLEELPFESALDGPASKLFVPASGDGDVTTIDTTANTAASPLALGVIPENVTADSVNGELYVVNEAPNTVLVVNGTTDLVQATVVVPGFFNTFVAVDPWTGDVLVGGGFTESLTVIGAVNDSPFATIPGVYQPHAALADPLNGEIYVGGSVGLYAINGATGRLIRTFSWGVNRVADPLALDPFDDHLFVSSGELLRIVNGTTDAEFGSFSFGVGAGSTAFDNATGRAYGAAENSTELGVFSARTGNEVSTIAVGTGAGAIAVDAVDSYLYVALPGKSQVEVFDPSSGTLVGTVTTPVAATGFQIDRGTGDVVVDEPSYSELSVIAAGAPKLSETVSVGIGPLGEAFDPVTGGLVTANEASGTLSFLAPTSAQYVVTFRESGLPGGTAWRAELDGVGNTSTSSTISFRITNGTFSYSVGATAYAATPRAGNVTVDGGAVTQDVAFAAEPLYTVTFGEEGLPTGTAWSVALEGVVGTSSARTLTFREPNGAFQFTAENVSGFYVAPPNGTVVVDGAAPSEVLFGFYPLYAVTFQAEGVPSTFDWYVEVTPGLDESFAENSSLGTTIGFALTNGSYTYYVDALEGGYVPVPNSGTFTVSGAPVTVTITFQQAFTVTFYAIGESHGSTWYVDLGGTTYVSSQDSLNISEPNGSYPFSVTPPLGYDVAPSSGTVLVDAANVLQDLTFTIAPGNYSVTFEQTGLPAGDEWLVEVLWSDGGAGSSSTGPTISFALENGTYSFEVVVFASGYTAEPSSGTFTVDGASLTIAITIGTEYAIVFDETGLANGTLWTIDLAGVDYLATAPTPLTVDRPNGAYNFSIVAPMGYLATPVNGNVTVDDASVEQAISFTIASGFFRVVFVETGLPAGASWLVNLSGTFGSNTNRTIVLLEPNGTYGYTINPPYPYASSPSTSSLTVAGLGVEVAVVCYPSAADGFYAVTFSASGLPVGANWSVKASSGATGSANVPGTIVLALDNSSYTYTARTTDPSYASSGGSFRVDGANVSVSAAYALVTFEVTATESGLPSGTTWWFNVTGGPSETGSGTSLTFPEANGTYDYTVATLDKRYEAVGGSFPVDGRAVSVPVTFTLLTWVLTFSESGLPSGTEWWVNGTVLGSQHTTSATLTVSEPNGSYAYTVGTVDKREASSAGTATVIGMPTTVPVTFAPVLYAVTFTESGLPSGSAWSVDVGGTPYSSTTSTIVVQLTNDSYPFTVEAVSGYSASPSGGTVVVAGKSVAQPVGFAPTSKAATFLGLPADEGYALLGGILAAVVVLAGVAVLLARRKSSPPPSGSGPGSPGPTSGGTPPAGGAPPDGSGQPPSSG